MLILILSVTNSIDMPEVVGYVLASIEIFLVLLRVLIILFPENTKFGKIIRVIFKGLKSVKTQLKDNKSSTDNLDNIEDSNDEENDEEINNKLEE